VLPFVIERVAQTWLSVPFASDLMIPEESEDFGGFDSVELRKGGLRIVKALVDSEENLQIPWLGNDHYLDSRTVVSLYHAMVGEDTDSANVRERFLRIFVHDALALAKKDPDLFDEPLLPIARLLADYPPNPESRPESYRTVCELITEIWTGYLQDVVQARPPTPDLTMSSLEVRNCSCGDCRQINSFLTDQNPSTSYRFVGSERRRRHLETELLAVHGRALICKTEKTGNTHDLMTRKALDLLHREDTQEWDTRVRGAKTQLRQCPNLVKLLSGSFYAALPQDSIEKVLGDYVVKQAAIEQAPPSNDTSLTAASGDAATAVTTTGIAKRKAGDDLVDPTERKRVVGSEGME
jgi:hypothetical protein